MTSDSVRPTEFYSPILSTHFLATPFSVAKIFDDFWCVSDDDAVSKRNDARGASVWTHCNKTNKNFQNIKKILNFNFSTELSYKHAKILDVLNLVKYQSSVFIYKVLNGYNNCEQINQLFAKNQIGSDRPTTRSVTKLRKPQYTLKTSCNCISWSGIDAWNNVPEFVKDKKSLCTFTKSLVSFYLEIMSTELNVFYIHIFLTFWCVLFFILN